MPYASPAQSRFIHAKASEGVAWAEKFVKDSHGTKVPKKPMYNPNIKRQQKPNYYAPYTGAKPGLGFSGPKKHGKHRRRTSLGSGNTLPGQKG